MQNVKLYNLLVLVSLFSLALLSCKDWKKGKFKITNHTSLQIDSLLIDPNTKKHFVSVKPGETISYFTNMDEEKNDGMHRFEYFIGGKKIFKSISYYSNGLFTEDLIELHIYLDSVSIKPVYK